MFDRTVGAKRERAHQCVGGTNDHYCEVGYLPYRANVALMDRLMGKPGGSIVLCRKLITLIDPKGILSPVQSGIELSA